MEKKFIQLWLFGILLILPLIVNAQTDSNPINHSVFRIYSTKNSYDFLTPYRAPSQHDTTGSGFLIEGNKIITNAHVVADASKIRIQKSNRSKLYKATVEFIGHDCDLAILKVEDPEFFTGLKPIKLGQPVKIKTSIEIYGFPIGGTEITVTSGIISRIQMQNYVHSGLKLLTYQIDAPINPGNSGGPALSNGTVVGVVHQSNLKGQNINHVIPIEILKHFLKDCESGSYKGFPSLPLFFSQHLINPELRKYFKLSSSVEGVVISWIAPDSYAKDILKVNDIIQSIEDYKVQNDGKIIYNDLLLPLNYLVSKKFIGESIKMEVLRDGKVATITLPLRISNLEIRKHLQSTYSKPKYYILGGLVFQPYTVDYYWKAKRQSNIPLNLISNLLFSQVEIDELSYEMFPDRVILSGRLSDDINEGYDLAGSVIIMANDVPVHTLDDLVKAIENNPKDYHLLKTNTHFEIVLFKKDLDKANKKILEKYQIHSDRYL